MGNVIGTIITVNDFLSTKECTIKIQNPTSREVAFSLWENRNYIIPDFQREIRWKKENLLDLMRDIKLGNRFLGNIILSKRSSKDFDVIDGQQRLSILLMLIKYIKKKYQDEITNDDEICGLKNETFLEYSVFAENGYSLEDLPPGVVKKIIESDKFNQRIAYQELWKAIESVDILSDSTSAREFLTNMKRCELNVIVSEEENTGYSIQYFLDVNLKGVRLDAEDIFKGYLFSLDHSESTRRAWTKLKQLSQEFNKKCNDKTKTRSKKDSYPLMKMIEHFFYCDLYLKEKYKNIVFGEDFCLKEEVVIEGRRHYIGEHLLKVINNDTYIRNCIERMISFMEIFIDIISSNAPSDRFKMYYKTAHVDEDEIVIFHNYFLRTLLERNLAIPKALLIKYALTILLTDEKAEKENCKKIYAIFLFNTLFTLFESKKGIEPVVAILKASTWYEETIRRISEYLAPNFITENKLSAQYRYVTSDENEGQQYRCKSLAAAYNYLVLSNDKVNVKRGKTKELKRFLSDADQYSVEHFIMNNSKKCEIIPTENATKFTYEYLKDCNKYISSLFNFIFIPQELNDRLGNKAVWEKVQEIGEENPNIKCDYSQMIVELVRKNFKSPISSFENQSEEEIKTRMNQFYSYEFKDAYSKYVYQVLDKVSQRFFK